MSTILAALLLAQAAQLPSCAIAPHMSAVLAAQHKERVVAKVNDITGRKVQLWSAKGWTTWTVTATDRAGTMCILSAGKGRPGPVGTPA